MDDPSKFALPPTTSYLPEEQHLKCPRCNSNNTNFCYYNNYNLSQPRHFCKDCRRYWTRGGALRNVPVSGGTRTKRSPTLKHSSTTSSSPSSTAQPSKNDSSALSSFDQNSRMIDAKESLISVLASNKLQFENLMEDLNRRV